MSKSGNSNSTSPFPNLGFGTNPVVPGQGMQSGPGMATPGLMPNVGMRQLGGNPLPAVAQPQRNMTPPNSDLYGFSPASQSIVNGLGQPWTWQPGQGGPNQRPDGSENAGQFQSMIQNYQNGGNPFGSSMQGLFGNTGGLQGLLGGLGGQQVGQFGQQPNPAQSSAFMQNMAGLLGYG